MMYLMSGKSRQMACLQIVVVLNHG